MENEKPARPLIAPTILTAIHGLLWVVVFILMMGPVSGYRKILEDFDAELPIMSQWAVNLSIFMAHYWYLGVLFIAVFCVADFVVLFFLHASAKAVVLRYVWVIAMLLVPICLMVWLILAVQLPMLQMTESLS